MVSKDIAQKGSPLMGKKTAKIKKTTPAGQTAPSVGLIVTSKLFIIL